MNISPSIVWFRNDLRLNDQPALHAAIQKGGPIIPVFIWETDNPSFSIGAASCWWLHHSLLSLIKDLKQMGLNLTIRTGKASQVLIKLTKETKADAIFCNQCFEPQVRSQDVLIKNDFESLGIQFKEFNGQLLFEPANISNKKNKPFQVFTHFWNYCQKFEKVNPPLSVLKNTIPYEKVLTSKFVEDLKLLPKIHWDVGLNQNWEPGESGANARLQKFLKSIIVHYHESRDFVDCDGVSHLSPHLHFGEISPRRVWHSVIQQIGLEYPGVQAFLRQLVWREFAHYLLYHFPDMPTMPLREKFKNFVWQDDPVALQAWQKGQTGYPIVDAGMRQLWNTGWMHNRARLIVGSFLVKDLLIHWHKGAEWFWDTLVDADLANNTMGWQWIAGCGADASPFFRVFNPITQGDRFDPKGDYIRRWVPELKNLPTKWIHCPWSAPKEVLEKAGISLGETYPFPIVDHGEARIRALQAFRDLKKV